MKSPILGAAYVARSINAADNRLINMYPESTPDGGKTAAYFQRVPGITSEFNFGGTGSIRGMWVAKNVLYIVVGSRFIALAGIGTSSFTYATISSSISGTGPVSMVDNGTQVFIATNPDGYIYNIDTTAFAKIGDPDFPGAVTVGYINGYFVFNEPNSQRVWVTELFDGSSIEPLSFASAEASPDNVVSLIVDHKEIWIFGNNSTEVWYDAGQPDYPLAPIQGAFLETGCLAPYSVAKMDNSVFWLGADARGFGMIYRARGYQPQRISTHAIEYAIQSYATVSDAIAYTYQQDGHLFYVLTFPTANATWVYDAATQMWHQRGYVSDATGVLNRHTPTCMATIDGKIYVGHDTEPKIGYYNFASSIEFSSARTPIWLRSWRALPTGENTLKRTAQHSLQLDCQAGTSDIPLPLQPAPGVQGPPWVVLTSDGTIYNVITPVVLRSNGSSVVFADPQFNLGPASIAYSPGAHQIASLRWSDDGGHTWSNTHAASMGFEGQTGKRVIWRRLGMTTKLRDRVYEVSGSGLGQVAIMGAELLASGTNA